MSTVVERAKNEVKQLITDLQAGNEDIVLEVFNDHAIGGPLKSFKGKSVCDKCNKGTTLSYVDATGLFFKCSWCSFKYPKGNTTIKFDENECPNLVKHFNLTGATPKVRTWEEKLMLYRHCLLNFNITTMNVNNNYNGYGGPPPQNLSTQQGIDEFVKQIMSLNGGPLGGGLQGLNELGRQMGQLGNADPETLARMFNGRVQVNRR